MVITVIHPFPLPLLNMTTKAEYILSHNWIRKDLHPGTVLFFEWTQDHVNYMAPSQQYNLGGIYFRRKVVDVDMMVGNCEFFTRHVYGLRNTKESFEAASLQHVDADSTYAYAVSIDKHIRHFIEISGGIERLPFHPDQRLHFLVQPKGLYSKTATAVYYKNFRAGYLNGGPGYHLVQAVGREKLELSYGIIERASDDRRTEAKLSIIIPQKHFVERAKLLPKPVLVWYEREDRYGTHYAPNLSEFPELYAETV
jgi:hypothetical protein